MEKPHILVRELTKILQKTCSLAEQKGPNRTLIKP